MSLNLRLLKRDELFKLRRFYKHLNSKIDPAKQLLTAAVAETVDERIVGFCGFELIPHVGPIEILPEFQKQGLGSSLYQLIESQLDKTPNTGYYTFPSNEGAIALVEKLGLEKLPWEVWKREY